MGNRPSGTLCGDNNPRKYQEARSSSHEDFLSGSKKKSHSFCKGVFKRKPTSIFLDYDGMTFDHYIRRKSAMRGHTQSLNTSMEKFPRRASESAVSIVRSENKDSVPIYEDVKVKRTDCSLARQEDISDEPSYESLDEEVVVGRRPIFYSMERQISHQADETADELEPEYYCTTGEEGRRRTKGRNGEDGGYFDGQEDLEEEEDEEEGQFYRPWSDPPQEIGAAGGEEDDYSIPLVVPKVRSKKSSRESTDGGAPRKGSRKESRNSSNMSVYSCSRTSDISGRPGFREVGGEDRVPCDDIVPMRRRPPQAAARPIPVPASVRGCINTGVEYEGEDSSLDLSNISASIDRLRGQVRTVTDTEDDLSERLQDCGSTQGTFSRGEEENTNYGSCETSERNTTSSETQHIQTSTDRSQGDKSQSVEIVLDTQPATHSRVHRDPPGFEGCKGTGAFVKDRVTEWVNYDTENATGDELPDLETGLEEEEEDEFDECNKHVEESTSRDEEQDTGFAKSSSRSCSVGSNQSSTNYHNFGATQTRDIRNSWSLILTRLQKVGVQCIVDLFELHPFVREHFTQIILNYGGLDPEDKNVMQGILENHAKLIMNIVHEVVMNIDDLDVMDAKLSRLGLFHFKNGIPERYLDIMGPIFCNAMRPILLQADRWTNAVEEAWMEVFKAITYFMKKSYQTEDDIPKEMFLVPTEKCIIVATWHSIFLKHMINMGKTLFVDMFRVEPNILKYFDAFKDNGINNLSMNRAFQSHGLRVMNLVKFVVENIENPGKLQNHMTILGKMHVKKGINQKYLDLMGPTFCQAIRPMVMAEGQWSIDIESAWARLFKMLVLMMSRAYTEKEVDRAVSFPNPRQTELILRSWQEIQQSLEEIGQEAFRKLFEAHSDIQDYFPAMKKLSSNDVEMSRHIKEHSTRIMDVIRMFVSNIHHLDRVLPRIENLGHEHYKSGVKSEYLDVMGPIFTHCVRPCLVRKDMWSLQIEEVWLLLIKKIAETMKKGFPKERRKTYRFLK